MTNNPTSTTDKLNHALHLIDRLPFAILEYMAPLGDVRQRLEELNGRTCTGNAHWRDKNTPGKARKLSILHGIDQPCPVHGQPPSGDRIRYYIGSKPHKISDALAAIERHTESIALYDSLFSLTNTLSNITWTLERLYRSLGIRPPEPGQDPPLSLPEDNQMVTK